MPSNPGRSKHGAEARERLARRNAEAPPYPVIPDQTPEGRRGDAWEAPPAPDARKPAAADAPAGPKQRLARVASTVPKMTPRWRWQSWLPEGELAILDGDPGLGKSTLTIDLAARVSRGWAMPPCERGQPDAGLSPAAVILVVGEDSPEYTVVHRLEAAGADMTRIHFLEGYRDRYGDRDFDLAGDLDDLELLIGETGAGFVVIDPFMAFIGNDIDAHKDQDIRRLLRPLSKLAQRTRAPHLCLRHLNKLNGADALYRGGGSIGIIGAARAAWIAGTDPQDEDRHILAMNKCNLGPKPVSLAYRLGTDGSGGGLRLEWDGEADLKPNDILAHAAPRKNGRPLQEREEAKRFLADLLSAGPVAAAEIRREADAALIAWRTVERAKADLDVSARKDGSIWRWQLPGWEDRQNYCPP